MAGCYVAWSWTYRIILTLQSKWNNYYSIRYCTRQLLNSITIWRWKKLKFNRKHCRNEQFKLRLQKWCNRVSQESCQKRCCSSFILSDIHYTQQTTTTSYANNFITSERQTVKLYCENLNYFDFKNTKNAKIQHVSRHNSIRSFKTKINLKQSLQQRKPSKHYYGK